MSKHYIFRRNLLLWVLVKWEEWPAIVFGTHSDVFQVSETGEKIWWTEFTSSIYLPFNHGRKTLCLYYTLKVVASGYWNKIISSNFQLFYLLIKTFVCFILMRISYVLYSFLIKYLHIHLWLPGSLSFWFCITNLFSFSC